MAAFTFKLFCLIACCLSGGVVAARGVNGGLPCAACTIVIGLVEQYIEVHNVTVEDSLDRFCLLLPCELRGMCNAAVDAIGDKIIALMELKATADVICYTLWFCHVDSGQQMCHLFPPPTEGMEVAVKNAQNRLNITIPYLLEDDDPFPCYIPGIRDLCRWLESIFADQKPGFDRDGDLFSIKKAYRGSSWRGKDCNDRNKNVHPGRRPIDDDINEDSNCNGIYGLDPASGKSYETEFCSETQPRGFIYIGDSIGAHFHLPPQWLMAAELTEEILANFSFIVANEMDWPHTSLGTGYMNVSWPVLEGYTDSLYYRLWKRNRCNHRDFQNLAFNGAMARDVVNLSGRISRNKTTDHPAVVFYAMQGNDVCNNFKDTLAHCTPPEEFRSQVLQTLLQLDQVLPAGSHVMLIGLVNGSVLYDALADRLHPIGVLHRDITYNDVFDWWNCMQVGPCYGWQNSNVTLRRLLTQKSEALSAQLKDISINYKFASFDMYFYPNPIHKVLQKWKQQGRQIWELIEASDGLHPNQLAQPLIVDAVWEDILNILPEILGPVNPHNEEIERIFGTQGGY